MQTLGLSNPLQNILCVLCPKESLTTRYALEWHAQRKAQRQRHLSLRCWSGASYPCSPVRKPGKDVRCPWHWGACHKEGCVLRQSSVTGVSLLLLPVEGCPRHATCHRRGLRKDSAALNLQVSPLQSEEAKDVFSASRMDNITTPV